MRQAHLGDLAHVAGRARELDALELLETSPASDLITTARRIWQMQSGAYVVDYKERPTAVIGWTTPYDYVATGWAYATDDLPRVGKSFTRLGKRIVEALHGAGYRRIQAFSANFHEPSHKWLPAIGLEPEAELKALGKSGADFTVFASVRDV